jgi:ATP adenylyltransferase
MMGEQPLWAPWRTEYVASARDDDCVFCAAPADGDDVAARIVDRGIACFTILNAYPYTSGHVMVVPYRHVAGLDELDEAEQLEMLGKARRAVSALQQVMRPHGFNLGLNLGEAAGAGYADHLHLHVVPRWRGDTNFMPVVAGTHVVSQALEATHEALADALHRLD